MGHNWKAIVTDHFPGRTALQARNQYNQFCRRTGHDTQPSTPDSIQNSATPLPTDKPLYHISPAPTKPRRPRLLKLPTDDSFEAEEWDDDLSSEDGNDNDDEDVDWLQSENCSQWNPASEASRMQAHQSHSHQFGPSPPDFESSTSSLPGNEMLPLSSFDHLFPDRAGFALGDTQAHEQASNQLFTGGQVWSAPIQCRRNLVLICIT